MDMALNPYAEHLGDRDARQVIAATGQRLQALLATLGPERAGWSPAPGKWSAREILCHLADCEIVFAFRLRQTLAQANHVIQPFDQDDWARSYKKVTHPERGEMTFQTVVETMGGHDLNHLGQIERIAGQTAQA
jgi:hypothetical protein